MRGIVALLVILVVLVAAGWIVFRNDAGNPTVQFQTEKANADINRVVEKTERIIESAKSGDTTTHAPIEPPATVE